MKRRILGVIGDPIEHSLSPKLHNWVLEQLKLDRDYEYRPFRVSSTALAAFLQEIREKELHGLNVTIPHKQSVVPLLDEIDPMADRLRAVNTIVRIDNKLKGYNTDGLGFLRAAVANKINLKNAHVVMLGAGGSAKAVAFALAETGIAHLSLYNRSPDRAIELRAQLLSKSNFSAIDVRRLSDRECLCADLSQASLLINTTPVGMFPHADKSPLPIPEALHEELTVYDLIYNPLETSLMREAHHRGARVFNGLDMLIYQGLESLRLWLSEKDLSQMESNISVPELREVLHEALGVAV